MTERGGTILLGFIVVMLLLTLVGLVVYAQEVRLRMQVEPSVEGNVTHVVLGMDPGTVRVVNGTDTLTVECEEWTLHFRGRVVSPTHVVREE
uniref:Uncharacterized protein n=1 Tax=viral metagenome TaxID=1070528 RepID=A0A6H2A6A1_9ZZZZ